MPDRVYPKFPFVIGGGGMRPHKIMRRCTCFDCSAVGTESYAAALWYDGCWDTREGVTATRKDIEWALSTGHWMTMGEADAHPEVLTKAAQDGAFPVRGPFKEIFAPPVYPQDDALVEQMVLELPTPVISPVLVLRPPLDEALKAWRDLPATKRIEFLEQLENKKSEVAQKAAVLLSLL